MANRECSVLAKYVFSHYVEGLPRKTYTGSLHYTATTATITFVNVFIYTRESHPPRGFFMCPDVVPSRPTMLYA